MPKPWEGEGGSFGSWLRQQREIRSISLREIADNTKIGLRYLAALEEDRFEVLPAPIFAKGFLREYAKYVGLDPDEVVNFYLTAEQRHRAERGGDEISGVLPMSPNATVPPPRGISLDWVIAAVAVILLALLVLGIVWMVRHHRADKKSTVQVEATPPTVAPVVAPVQTMAPAAEPTAASPSAPLVVTLSFTAECWVDALVDGERRVSVLRVQGESMHIDASDSVVLTLGNASAVRADVNGKPLRLGNAPGQVVRDMVIDRTTAGLPPATDQAATGH